MINAIEVENVSKKFVVSRQRPTDLREKLMQRFRPGAAEASEFWVLKDVSFSVEPGTSVGIVGHNGSGKSTMLKLLTGILKPTSGSIRARGRIGALIEVGAGFHPDLTGRENIYLNGSILGLSRQEITRKFDGIVTFAGLERFIDTPVKRYSSGMYMRLGFAIAAHMDADILLIDEVLAVGDQQFQNKCMRQMKEFVAQGGTVVFVSHAMTQVAELCRQCVWLDHGQVLYFGETHEAVDRYMALVAEREEEEFKRSHPEEWSIRQAERRQADAELQAAQERERQEAEKADADKAVRREADPYWGRVLGVTLLDASGQAQTCFRAGEPLRARIEYAFRRHLPHRVLGLEIFRGDGLHMFSTSNYDHDVTLSHLPLTGHLTLSLPFLSLNEGVYRIRLSVYPDSTVRDWHLSPEHSIDNALEFRVVAGRFAHGCVYLPFTWEVNPPAAAAPAMMGALDPDRAPLIR